MKSFLAGAVSGFIGLYLFFVWYYWDIPVPVSTGLFIQNQAIKSVPYLLVIAGLVIAITFLIDHYVRREQKFILEEGRYRIEKTIKEEKLFLNKEYDARVSKVRAMELEIYRYNKHLDERDHELLTFEDKLLEKERQLQNKKRDFENARGAAQRRKEQLKKIKKTKDI